MEILPAIDIRHGRVVRLAQGEAARATTYHDDPVAQAEVYAWQGARWLHLVDLDRAFGDGDNSAIVGRIIQRVGSYVQIQLGGGLRGMESIRRALQLEATRLVLGTVVQSHPELVPEILAEAGPIRIAVALDGRGGMVASEGWTQTGHERVLDVARRVVGQGVRTIVYTDITRDGMMRGPDLKGAAELKACGAGIISSGGVGSLDDLRALQEAGMLGAVVGRALYEGRFTLHQAIRQVWL